MEVSKFKATCNDRNTIYHGLDVFLDKPRNIPIMTVGDFF